MIELSVYVLSGGEIVLVRRCCLEKICEGDVCGLWGNVCRSLKSYIETRLLVKIKVLRWGCSNGGFV